MDRQYDGRWTRTRCQPSNFSLLSRSAESHWHWTEDVEVSHLYLSNDLLSRVAGDMLDQAVDEVQLHDVLRGTDPLLSHMVDQITREAAHASVGGPLYVEALGVQLAVHLLRDYASCVTRRQKITGCLSPAQQASLEDYIDAHLQDRITLEAMAGLFNMGVWTFSRQVRKSLGCTAYALVMRRRMERARVLLVRSRMPLKQIAAMCGFSDQAHMTRQFRVQHGTTPSQYRQMA